jgi:Domain of unknown function (DUF3291)
MHSNYHLCQVNIALGKELTSHPVMADFVAQLDEINAIADTSPGFIWRLQSDNGHAVDIRVYDNPKIIYNMSIWESADALHQYTYRTQHATVFANRKDWFLPLEGPQVALWWIKAGDIPETEEGKRRLDYLREHGPSEYAFTFKQTYPVPQAS